MGRLDPIQKQDAQHKGFSETVSHERHHRTAMTGLHDIIVFSKAVKKEMDIIENDVARGGNLDRDLYRRMVAVDEAYQSVMAGFMNLNDDDQRHLLIVYADAVKDLMGYVHHMRKNQT